MDTVNRNRQLEYEADGVTCRRLGIIRKKWRSRLKGGH